MTAEALRIVELERENALLHEEMASLRQQVAWFRRQIFGSRSERLFGIDPVLQGNLFAEFGLEEAPDRETPDEAPASPRRRSKRRDTAVNDSGLRFDESVPVETIIVENLAAARIPEGEREEIGEKVVCRVAQEIGSYRVLRYVMKTYGSRSSRRSVPRSSRVR